MLDIRFIKDNLGAVKANIAARHMHADPDKAVLLHEQKLATLQTLEDQRRRRNEVAEAMKGKLSPEQRTPLIDEGKRLKETIAGLEASLAESEAALHRELWAIPNMAHPDAPIGAEDTSNLEVARFGAPTQFAFPAKDHVELGQALDILDFDTATRVCGTKFYYLKNEAVLLDLALQHYAINKLVKAGFTPFITPDIAKTEILEGIGFNPRGPESNIYAIEGEDMCLIGTAEITLGGYYSGQILDKAKLPLRMVGISHCFRREAGASGQFSKGLYRVHQFTKIEMFVICAPEDSGQQHAELRKIEEELFAGLGIPFRVVDTCTGDLGAPAYRKWDLEAWMPGRNSGEWGEVTSTSNCTDYQSRRLNIRFKDLDGKNKYAHMLNGTAIACSRALVSILENFQQADGSVRIPAALVPYTGFDVIKAKQ
ncbi:MAG: serine--tRNA ligase [Spirochaetes bacterium GWD1_61_31]|nr:MAG: serine--tRNA ligase [Spirochaetes bacterium GWB1_60_80]OHD31686.1 MAG: serine--tRNA ligase [Spirochaetes bacterium GWC1_61_12]OHD41483.1 MAG: serine--tRNA ligase [Spirochaetes bacterium GWE1_60_18]OHD42406.1 MAG: serine--tRNA ligase [Spirochaetes bacterium GWD1_61_31]OHD61385.1 MAG: serine--tRNA ligase [Spirochaetes bacterium GWF1_60_12]HAP44517.1 serine--tRNA ligase [Spirochaetaceae bacterium]